MRTIRKKLVTDESHRPIAVMVDYEDWLEIERLVGAAMTGSIEPAQAVRPEMPSERDFQALASAVKGCWAGEDGLAYQIRIREEWDRA